MTELYETHQIYIIDKLSLSRVNLNVSLLFISFHPCVEKKPVGLNTLVFIQTFSYNNTVVNIELFTVLTIEIIRTKNCTLFMLKSRIVCA